MKKTVLLVFLIGLGNYAFSQSEVLSLDCDKRSGDDLVHSSVGTLEKRLGVSYVNDRFGNGCRAIKFSGGYLQVPHRPAFDFASTGFSVAAWVNLSDEWLTLVCKGRRPSETPNSPSFRFQIYSGRTISVNSASTKKLLPFTYQLPQNQWMHLALTTEVLSGKKLGVKLYADGQLVFEQVIREYLTNNKEPLFIGLDVPGDRELATMSIDDFKLFAGVLTAKDIRKLHRDRSSKGLGNACPPEEPSDNGLWTNLPTARQTDKGDLSTVVTQEDKKGSDIDPDANSLFSKNLPTPIDEKEADDRIVQGSQKQPTKKAPIKKQPAITPAKGKPTPSTSTKLKEEDTEITADNGFFSKLDYIKEGEVMDLEIKFERSKYDITPESANRLDSLILWMETHDISQYSSLLVLAHTSPEGKERSNQLLSERRAMAVRHYIETNCTKNIAIEWEGYGSAKPVVHNTTEESRAKNRRVEIMFRK